MGGCTGSAVGTTTYVSGQCYKNPHQSFHFSCSSTLNSSADTCSLYQIADGSCGQSDLNCDYVKCAKAAEKGLQDGTCADQGYTHQTGTQTKTYPIIGEIVITTYDQGLSSSSDIDIDCS